MRYIKQLLAAVLATVLLTIPALAAGDEPTPQAISLWAYESIADIYALGMWSDSYYYCILDPVTEEQLTKMTDAVAARLALLELPQREYSPATLVLDGTRGAVMEALYREAARYDLPSVDMGAVPYLAYLGVIYGEPAVGRVCTLQEALVMAQRLILAVYDSQDAGGKGFLWKATSGENTLYLLGTVHVDRGNVYPFHKSLREALSTSQLVAFEIDFGDTADFEAFSGMQFYSDGSTLKDHVPADLYTLAVKAGEACGLTEAQVATFKPWALTNFLQSTSLIDTDGTAGGSGAETPMMLDMFVYSTSANLGHTIDAIESAVYQGQLFDELSDSCQQEMLRGQVENHTATTESNATSVDKMVAQWATRDVKGFEEYLNKDESIKEGGEYMEMLLTKRDPGMIEYADRFLKEGGSNTGLITVGAAHMVGEAGIVQGLKDLGYTVELVP